MWLIPDAVRATACNCSIRVNMDTVHQLREDLGGNEAREASLCFMDAEFEARADDVYGDLHYPEITLSSAWDIFVAVVDILSHDYE
jgi:hypothetical protein